MKKEIELAFIDAGWHPDRKIDLEYEISELENNNYSLPNEIIKSVMEQYGNLRVGIKEQNGFFTDAYFNLDEALNITSSSTLKKMENLSRSPLVPVRVIYSDTIMLIMSYSGKLYTIGENKLYLVGNNFEEAMSNIFDAGEFKEIS